MAENNTTTATETQSTTNLMDGATSKMSKTEIQYRFMIKFLQSKNAWSKYLAELHDHQYITDIMGMNKSYYDALMDGSIFKTPYFFGIRWAFPWQTSADGTEFWSKLNSEMAQMLRKLLPEEN